MITFNEYLNENIIEEATNYAVTVYQVRIGNDFLRTNFTKEQIVELLDCAFDSSNVSSETSNKITTALAKLKKAKDDITIAVYDKKFPAGFLPGNGLIYSVTFDPELGASDKKADAVLKAFEKEENAYIKHMTKKSKQKTDTLNVISAMENIADEMKKEKALLLQQVKDLKSLGVDTTELEAYIKKTFK